jgi:hypothetical protein
MGSLLWPKLPSFGSIDILNPIEALLYDEMAWRQPSFLFFEVYFAFSSHIFPINWLSDMEGEGK